ncbi:Mitochondrial substrate/solute carrier [Dillenia turbinata]|uniref:Mitochondrial substrate/solute carrier n=1 Tax=Dillenia turbinata TaxID=194707 RepID=A0AAN8VWT1_9MAGN
MTCHLIRIPTADWTLSDDIGHQLRADSTSQDDVSSDWTLEMTVIHEECQQSAELNTHDDCTPPMTCHLTWMPALTGPPLMMCPNDWTLEETPPEKECQLSAYCLRMASDDWTLPMTCNLIRYALTGPLLMACPMAQTQVSLTGPLLGTCLMTGHSNDVIETDASSALTGPGAPTCQKNAPHDSDARVHGEESLATEGGRSVFAKLESSSQLETLVMEYQNPNEDHTTSLSAMLAETCTFPIDITKTRLQLHQHNLSSSYSSSSSSSSSSSITAIKVVSEIVRH